MSDFEGEQEDQNVEDEQVANTDENPFDNIEDTQTASGTKKKTYKGFGVVATMEIPKTNFKYPILEKVTKKSIETAVAFLYGTGLNQSGNSVIIGHNYRNDKFFSHVPELSIGDEIEITDRIGDTGTLTYKVYDKYVVDPEDTECTTQRTNGMKEITLITCTRDSKQRVIVKAREAE